MADPATIALALQLGKTTLDTMGNVNTQEQELEARGVNVPWTQKWLPWLAGPLGGSLIKQQNYQGKLDRTAPEMALRQPLSADITAAGIANMEAQERLIGGQVSGAIQQDRISRAGRGVYSSGAGFEREQDIRQGGVNALANAMAQTGLQTIGLQQQGIGLQQQGAAFDLQAQIAQTQMQYQKQQIENEAWGSMLEAMMTQAWKQPESNPMMSLQEIMNFANMGQQQPQLQQQQFLPAYQQPYNPLQRYDDYVG